MRKKKGEYGYLLQKKRKDLLLLLLYLGIALIIFGVGLALNKMSSKNIFTVVAILFVLPWARVFVEFVLLFPYGSGKSSNYEKMKQIQKAYENLYTGVVVTSAEQAMGLEFIMVGPGYVYGVMLLEKQDVKTTEAYLKKGVQNWSDSYQVKVWKDFSQFENACKTAKTKEINQKEHENVLAFIESIMV